jgi:hypothetical protein
VLDIEILAAVMMSRIGAVRMSRNGHYTRRFSRRDHRRLVAANGYMNEIERINSVDEIRNKCGSEEL